MAEHATTCKVVTCAEHEEITTGKAFLTCEECNSIYANANGDGWYRYRPEAWVTDAIADAVAGVGGQAFPVGSVFLSVVETDPATLLGYGTWAAFGAGKMFVGQDTGDSDFDTLEETGGAKTVTLTEAQIPAHTHVQDSHNHTQDAHGHGVTDSGHSHLTQRYPTATGGSSGFTIDTSMSGTLADNTLPTKTNTTGVTVNNATATNQAATAVNQNTGGGQAHSNMPPYIVVKMWKRTA